MFTLALEDNIHVENKSKQFTLTTQVSHKNAKVTWHKGEKEIFPSRKYKIVQDQLQRCLIIHNLEKTDAGQYIATTLDDRNSTNLIVDNIDLKFNKGLDEKTVAFEKESLTLNVETSHPD